MFAHVTIINSLLTILGCGMEIFCRYFWEVTTKWVVYAKVFGVCLIFRGWGGMDGMSD